MPTEENKDFTGSPTLASRFLLSFIRLKGIERIKMLGQYIDQLREKAPLIHNITNYVTVNDVANIILAAGASPIMADELKEVEEITTLSGGLTINIGTLNERVIASMFLAGKKARELGHALVLDPVGAGASKLRTQTALQLMEEVHFDVIRGNASEIRTLALGTQTTKGVDVSLKDVVTEENLSEAVSFVKAFSKESQSIIAMTGKIDLVANEKVCYIIRNGRKEMGNITGTGCQLSGLTTAFITANPNHPLEATAAAVCAMGVAGEIGLDHLQEGEGNSTYRNRIIDAIDLMDGKILDQNARYEKA